ncbi:protocadherin gamma-C5-like isoform X1 [Brienomyrus brachyistius]|uniref:protocadherin gamma-C5-like isoform X1 n=1 Tax=Brienomyrus brachyistius TaxID=42636 RepID=UPI0020B3710F|nr:protocadherin gamma-C5-like isoform X1 [Brienomyrus brachyistius]
MECRKRKRAVRWFAVCLFCNLTDLFVASLELSYSVSEELQPGAFVGNVVKDLGLDVRSISKRKLRVVSDSNAQYFDVNSATGALVIKKTIDRERTCELSSTCSLHFQIVLENPLEVNRIVVEITDVNDNAPQFPSRNISLEMSEAAAPGTTFRLQSAQDLDVGLNSLRTYFLSPNDCYILKVETKSDGSKFPELVLEKALDREKQGEFRLLLTAVDGGKPEKSGTTTVIIKILDVNDNAPVFDEPSKRVSLLENSPPGTLVTKLNATDADSGLNGEISFLFSKYTPDQVLKLFSVDAKTGEVRVTGEVDYEKADVYDITVQARDRGSPAMEGSCTIKVEITDVNDNTPEVTITSLNSPVKEDSELGTVIALINVKDQDSRKNGEVTLRIPAGLPFKLNSPFQGHYTVVTTEVLDRETVAEYTVVVTATDSGSPPLSSQSAFVVRLLDVNDNAPAFSQPSYTVDVTENNAPGALLLTLSAYDPDVGENSRLSFSILDGMVDGSPVSSYVYVDSETGRLQAVRSLDHEQLKAFRVNVQVRDGGLPAQSSNVTVHVFITDQNDNSPVILYPPVPRDGNMQLRVPRSAGAGYLVGKIVGVDPDSGHNAWLLYSIAPGPHANHFRIGPHTGELTTARRLKEEEEEEGSMYNFVVVVQDNGKPSLSTSVEVSVTVEEKSSQAAPDTRRTTIGGGMADSILYLIVSLASVSAVCFVTVVVLAVRCLRRGADPGCGTSCEDSCCYSRRSLRSRQAQQRSHKNLHLQLNTDGPIKYVEVVGGPTDPNTHTYRPCYSTLSSRSDFVFVKTPMLSHNNTLSMTLSRKHLIAAQEQKPPNTDWRFSQNQRPGPSGCSKLESAELRWTSNKRTRAGVPPEGAVGTGPWPNPPTEAEQLQALMAAANEVSEATATLGPGTMGLSTRYSPQFTLQHVPDYRQNVYIPGSTATLTANPQQQALPPPQAQAPPPTQAEPPKAAQTPASKKKSAKKEKK